MNYLKKLLCRNLKFPLLIILFLATENVFSQEIPISQNLLHDGWNAHWISCAGVPAKAYGVYHFRKKIDLPAQPSKFISINYFTAAHLFPTNKTFSFIFQFPFNIFRFFFK
jgi:hypothetical protein